MPPVSFVSSTKPAVAHRDQPVGGRGDPRVVGHDDERLAACVEALEQAQDVGGGGTVEISGRLVGEHDERGVGERAGDRHALAAARPTEPSGDDRPGPRGRRCSSSSVARSRALRGELPARSAGSSTFSIAVSSSTRWNDWNTNPSAWRLSLARPGLGGLLEPAARELERAGGRALQPSEQVQQRGLAAAARPYDRHRFALGDIEADVVDRADQRRPFAVLLAQAAG